LKTPDFARNQASIDHVKRLPVGDLLEDRSQPHQFILDQEWHHMCELHCFLFAIGEAGDVLSLHERRAFVSYMPKYTGRVADQRDRLAGIVE
jgi:hypothetical protein